MQNYQRQVENRTGAAISVERERGRATLRYSRIRFWILMARLEKAQLCFITVVGLRIVQLLSNHLFSLCCRCIRPFSSVQQLRKDEEDLHFRLAAITTSVASNTAIDCGAACKTATEEQLFKVATEPPGDRAALAGCRSPAANHTVGNGANERCRAHEIEMRRC